ncbi:30S ribosomal protein S9 [Candidatus Woesearchaeota archaeon RBG_13_36_6]|nr:MAG: 30S ribosomal protein S9 [Candidatus Woesearchaeota archaeon RBG_13_36_6]
MKIVHASGKRKMAIARVTLRAGNGKIKINNQLLDTIEPKLARMKIKEPLILAGELGKDVDINVNVLGGGNMSQAEASRLAIARALVDYSKDSKLEKTFLDYDRQLLVADVRRKEVYKPNRSKARAKRQKSYR